MDSNVKYTKNIPKQDSVFIEMKIEIEEHVISEFCQNDSGFASCNSDAEIKREGGCNPASRSHFLSGFQNIGQFLEASLTKIEPSFYGMSREGEQLNNNLKDLKKSTGITLRNNKQPGSKCTKQFSNRQKENLELLNTKEKLFVYLLKHDLRELQETFRKKPSEWGEETKSRRHLQNNVNKSRMFACRSCPFRCDTKYLLMVHVVEKHEDVAQQKKLLPSRYLSPGDSPDSVWFKCTDCLYVTSRKQSLERHLSTHKSIEVVAEMFRCGSCLFESTTKSSLERHVVMKHISRIHNTGKVETFKCRTCDFQTKYQGNLKRHLLVHGEPEDVNVFKCAKCPFSTITKQQLATHVAVHMNVYMDCDKCDFRTKFRSSLYKHKKLRHPA